MGNFSGHFFSGIAVFCLAMWWLYNGASKYIKSRMGHCKYESQYSYHTMIRGRNVPIEQILKATFSSLLLMGEVFISKFHYEDEDGNLVGVGSLMHLSYYLIYFVHCVVDLLMKSGVQGFPQHMDFYTAALAFFWNALSLYYHVALRPMHDVEYALHVMPTYFIYLTAFSHLLMPFIPTSYLPDLMRCYGLTVMGTWFFNTGFVLYKPGMEQHSPLSGFDLKRKQNIAFIHTLLGFHISLGVVIIVIAHQITYRIVNRRLKGQAYQKLNNNNKYHDEMESLMIDS